MKYLVIGLGNFGSIIAEELLHRGDDVIGIDVSEQRVEDIKERISVAYLMDATEQAALHSLPLGDIDAVIVAIGHSMSASLRTVAALKKLQVKNIFVRAIDSVHLSILEAMSIDQIFIPESYAARIFVDNIKKGGALNMT